VTPGAGQVRALIVKGGNPVAAWPDQQRTLEAMEDLELLVVIDHRMTQTALHNGSTVKIGNTTMSVKVVEEDPDV